MATHKDDFIPDVVSRDDFIADAPVAATRSRLTTTPEHDALRAANFVENVKGIGQAVGNTALAGVQWAEDVPRQVRELQQQPDLLSKVKYLLGHTNRGEPSTVTPTPPSLQPNTPGQALGRKIGGAGLYTGLAAATGGMSLPAEVAAGGVGSGLIAAGEGQNPRVAAAIGTAAPIASRVSNVISSTLRAKDNPARALNATIEVPKSVPSQINPGKRLLDEGDINLGRMGVSKETLQKVLTEREKEVGQQLGQELSRYSSNSINLAGHPGLDTPEAADVLQAMGKSYTPGQPLQMTPAEVHRFRSLLGDKINWSESAPSANDATGTNELLKTLYRDSNSAIDQIAPDVKALNAKWADYHIGKNAIGYALRGQARSLPGLPSSTVMGNVRRLGSTAPITTTYAPLSRALALPTLPNGMVRTTVLGLLPQQQ
jgi:hypothetical protein